MAQLATVLQTTHLIAAEGGITWSTTVYDGSTGIETRNQAWTTPRQVWTLTWAGLESEIQPVIDLFDEAEGMTFSFLFTPPASLTQGDFRFASDECRPAFQASAASELIGTITLPVIEVLDE